MQGTQASFLRLEFILGSCSRDPRDTWDFQAAQVLTGRRALDSGLGLLTRRTRRRKQRFQLQPSWLMRNSGKKAYPHTRPALDLKPSRIPVPAAMPRSEPA